MAIERVGRSAGPGGLARRSTNDLSSAATVAPPAPFSGTATFTADPGKQTGSWLGDLSVSFPGRPDVRLAGRRFEGSVLTDGPCSPDPKRSSASASACPSEARLRAARSVGAVDDEDGALEVGDGGGGDGAGEVAEQAVALVGADHDQAALVVFGDLDQALPGGGRLDRQGLGVEAGLAGQGGAVLGGFLRPRPRPRWRPPPAACGLWSG